MLCNQRTPTAQHGIHGAQPVLVCDTSVWIISLRRTNKRQVRIYEDQE